MITNRELKQLLIDSGMSPETLVEAMGLTMEETVEVLEDLMVEKKSTIIEELFPEFVNGQEE